MTPAHPDDPHRSEAGLPGDREADAPRAGAAAEGDGDGVAHDGARPAPGFGSRRADLWVQIVLVLGVSLGASALWSILNLAEVMSTLSIAESQATMNQSMSALPVFDVLRQVLSIVLALVPVLLALYFLAGSAGSLRAVCRQIGLDLKAPIPDVALGALLFLVMGLGTLALYQAGRALGLTAELTTNAGGTEWWNVVLLIAQALRHSLVEEIIVVAFLADRLLRVRWSWPAIIVGTALLRGSYHLYQGIGPALGNVVMGVVFLWIYRRTGRVMPLIVAHFLLDATGFLAGAYFFG
ncbi:CPBP family intramembrane metalloprotease [Kocuria coralli]|uniref:CPBP family intramembrane metalloprotease n=1 Tax=Kocuria coralli TaxID=1461025 RepID=A0A5J5KW21_9MICC|nr:CPBP family intramembrane glutamic endopeptidase [Kocuria coralli]KAA9393794.1 CPBP family intramembrane metalloprotease [Kocuria coralli]